MDTMKRFSRNEYFDALVKLGILVLTYHFVVLVIGMSLDLVAFPLEVHEQNIYPILSVIAVLYLIVLYIVKKTT